jgi:hypothetical protein
MKRIKIYIIIICLLFIPKALFSQARDDILASYTVNPNEGYLGDVLKVEIIITYNQQLRILPVPMFYEKPFFLRNFQTSTGEVEGKKVYKVSGEIMVFDTGIQYLPTKNVQYETPNEQRTLVLPAPKIIIKSLLEKEVDQTKIGLKDIKNPLKLSVAWKRYLIIILIIGLLGLLTGLAYLLMRKRNKVEEQEAVIELDERTPYERALDELKELKKKDLLRREKVKEHYVILSEIIKAYLARVYKEKMLEMTSEEIIEYMQKSLDMQTHRRLINFLEICDLAKFAKYRPAEEETQIVENKGYELLKRINSLTTEKKMEQK